MKKVKYITLFLILALGAAFLANKTYNHFFFDIEKYMITKMYDGDAKRHQEAKDRGNITYYDNYVSVGVPHPIAEYTVGYYRKSDGQLYCRQAMMCYLLHRKKNIFTPITDFFNKKNIPLTCACPPNGLGERESCQNIKCAFWHNEVDTITKLINDGESLNIIPKDTNGYSPLMQTISQERFEMSKILLENGADVNYQTPKGKTALHKLSKQVSRDKTVEKNFALLIKHGANINAQDKLGYTPLHLLINWTKDKSNHLKIFEDYLIAGANPNIKNNEGQTVLNRLVLMGGRSKGAVQLLLKYGADPNIKDNKGRSALDIAREDKNSDIIELLENK